MRLPRGGVWGALARLRSIWRGVRRRGQVEAEMAEEFRHHIELRTEHLIRQGLAPADAARRARLEFGHVESHKEEARVSRGLRPFDEMRFSWLDVKLGLRMLAKYPGLSVVSVAGMAVAIAVGAGAFSAISAMMDPTLPLPGSERIVSLQNTTNNPGNPERRALHDFLFWRQELETVRDVSAFLTDARNLILPDGSVHLVPIAEMTASGFRVAGIAPLMGRPLLDDDERVGAERVVVIGYDEWQRRFDGRADVIGQAVRLGANAHTVVGVMPEGFRFPVNHRYWTALRLNPTGYAVGQGPSLQMFGRLAEGATIEEAQAELATLGRRMAAEYPESHAHRRPQVLPYTHPYFDIDTPGTAILMHGLRVAVSLLLVLIALNVAVLVYARTATRTGEITVRAALGATRKRIVTQLFAEAFVLSALAAGIGILVAGIGLSNAQTFLERAFNHNFPFWFDIRLTAAVGVYAAGLAVLAGAIVGVVPALKATGGRVQTGLQRLSTRGSSIQLGTTWTALIVAQVAMAVFVLPFAVFLSAQAVGRGTGDHAYATDQVLVAWTSMEREEGPTRSDAAAYDSAHHGRYLHGTDALLRRLETDPAVAGVAFVRDALHAGRYGRIEVEGGIATGARISDVDVDLFEVIDLPVLAGRGFTEAGTRADARVAVVDRVLARGLLGGGDVLGRRIRVLRYSRGPGGEPGEVEAGPWREVVGVVPAHGTQTDLGPATPRLYLPATLASLPSVGLAVRVRDRPALAFAPRLREITAAVDPRLLLHDIRSGANVERNAKQALFFLGLIIAAVTASVLLLSAAGIYAMMSFTVARRRREIGIRSALGAAPRRVIGAIFARAGWQLGAGVGGGLVLAIAAERAAGGLFGSMGLVLFAVVSIIILTIGLAAALGPARRILAVQPTDALREE